MQCRRLLLLRRAAAGLGGPDLVLSVGKTANSTLGAGALLPEVAYPGFGSLLHRLLHRVRLYGAVRVGVRNWGSNV